MKTNKKSISAFEKLKNRERKQKIYITYVRISVKKTSDNRQRKDRGNCDYDDYFVVG